MAWTAPHTYTDGEIVTHTTLNTDVRDNLIVLDNHRHNNASGQGDSILGSLDLVSFSDGGLDPANTGTIRRNGTTLKYHDGTGVVVIGGVAVAGTPSLRAIGTVNGTQGAPGTHTHVFTTGSGSTALGTGILGFVFDSSSGSVSTSSPDIHTTGSSTINLVGVFLANNPSGGGSGSLIYDGTLIGTVAALGNGKIGIVDAVVSVGSGTFNGTVLYNPTSAAGASIIILHSQILEVGTPS